MPPRQHRHVGAYGLLETQGRVLLLRKERGPYRGQFDLPGGGIEFGEEPVAALQREFLEETGLRLATIELKTVASHRTSYRTADGQEEELHHLGLIYRVTAQDAGTLKTGQDGQDSGGCLWLDGEEAMRQALAPMARAALERVRR